MTYKLKQMEGDANFEHLMRNIVLNHESIVSKYDENKDEQIY